MTKAFQQRTQWAYAQTPPFAHISLKVLSNFNLVKASWPFPGLCAQMRTCPLGTLPQEFISANSRLFHSRPD